MPKQTKNPVELDHSTSGADEASETNPLSNARPAAGPAFADLGVRPETVTALEKVGINHAFAIQELTLPIALAGSDLIGQARTGTGKTLGFGIPVLQQVTDRLEGSGPHPQALIVVPTRELCLQVTADLTTAAATRELSVLAVYGGRPYEAQIQALRSGAQIVVGTPGRLLDLAQQKHLVLSDIRMLVLDEADEMLDLGFLPDVEKILSRLPEQRQTMLFSATMPGPIITMARQFMHKPMHIRAETSDDTITVPNTTQYAYRAHALDKEELLARALQADGRGRTMVFCRTKRAAQRVADELVQRGFAAGAVHGDLNQEARERALKKFRKGTVDVLVCTDVAARGIDIEGVTHVLNFHVPDDEKTYVHRIGRTGRAGNTGVAVTFVDWEELSRWQIINKLLGLGFHEPQETYSTSHHLTDDLGVPADATGRVGERPIRREPASAPESAPAQPSAATRPPRQRRRTRRGQENSGTTAPPPASTSHQVDAPAETPRISVTPGVLMPVFAEPTA